MLSHQDKIGAPAKKNSAATHGHVGEEHAVRADWVTIRSGKRRRKHPSEAGREERRTAERRAKRERTRQRNRKG